MPYKAGITSCKSGWNFPWSVSFSSSARTDPLRNCPLLAAIERFLSPISPCGMIKMSKARKTASIDNARSVGVSTLLGDANYWEKLLNSLTEMCLSMPCCVTDDPQRWKVVLFEATFFGNFMAFVFVSDVISFSFLVLVYYLLKKAPFTANECEEQISKVAFA